MDLLVLVTVMVVLMALVTMVWVVVMVMVTATATTTVMMVVVIAVAMVVMMVMMVMMTVTVTVVAVMVPTVYLAMDRLPNPASVADPQQKRMPAWLRSSYASSPTPMMSRAKPTKLLRAPVSFVSLR